MAGTFKVDDSGQRALLRHYGQAKLDTIFQTSARAGAKAAAEVMRGAAPIGRSQPLSAVYRREGLEHGALRASVGARRIRKRGMNRGTIGFVVGPAGVGGFARHWVTGGTRPHRIGRRQHPGSAGNPWVDRIADEANAAAARASEAVIVRYISRIPRA